MTHSLRARGELNDSMMLGRATLSMELSRVDMNTLAATKRRMRLWGCMGSRRVLVASLYRAV